jgi:hypothetical protein
LFSKSIFLSIGNFSFFDDGIADTDGGGLMITVGFEIEF